MESSFVIYCNTCNKIHFIFLSVFKYKCNNLLLNIPCIYQETVCPNKVSSCLFILTYVVLLIAEEFELKDTSYSFSLR